jgi:hypothetical protein
VGVSFSRNNKLFEGVAMRKTVAVLLSGVMLFTPVSQSLGDSIEIRGNLYNQLGLPKGDGPGDLTLLQGKIGGGITPPAGACGLNAALSLFSGMRNLQGLGQQLAGFISDWQSAFTAVALMTLATYFPLAKEALLGANTISSFFAQLRGFSCSQAMETIKELNYQDSFLIKKCIAKRLGISVEDVDAQRETSFDDWKDTYKSCLNSTSLLDLFQGDEKELNKYLKFISPRSLARCYLGVKNKPSAEELANADLQTKAKYFLYMVLPDITVDAKGLLNIQTVPVVETKDGKVRIANTATEKGRPATTVDSVKIYIDNFVEDYDKLLENLKSVVKYNMSHEEVMSLSEPLFDEFKRKYGIGVDDMSPTLVLLLRMRDYLDKKVKGEIPSDTKVEDYNDLSEIDMVLKGDVKRYFLGLALDSLEMSIIENAMRLKQAETMRKAVGSGNMPGKLEDKDDCGGDSSGGST